MPLEWFRTSIATQRHEQHTQHFKLLGTELSSGKLDARDLAGLQVYGRALGRVVLVNNGQ